MTLERLEEIKHAIATGQFIKLTEEIGFYSDLIEVIDLAAVALKRRAADAARAAASRGKPKKRRKPIVFRKPLDAVGKDAPPAPVMPVNVPVLVRNLTVAKLFEDLDKDMQAAEAAATEEFLKQKELPKTSILHPEYVFPPGMGQTIKPIIVSNIPKPPPES